MNYIKEINAFYDWLELNELTKSGVLLWHALMHLNNKSGWQESFTVARSVIEAKTGLKKDAYYKARNQLKQHGLISFKEKGTKATAFTIHPFLSEKQTKKETSYIGSSVKQTRTQTTNETTPETRTQTTNETINALNETKRNETNDDVRARENPHAIYQNNFGVENAMISDEINQWCDDLSEEMVIEAMKMTLEKNVHNFSYTKKILMNWFKRGFRNMGDVHTHENKLELEREKEVKPSGGNWSGPRKAQGKSGIGATRSPEESVTGGQVGRIRSGKRA